MSERPRILVTNDDGIDSIGLHVLARSMRPFGDVMIVAPDDEYSGFGAAIGAIWENSPEIHERQVDGIDTAWSVSGPPALCALLARIGAFGQTPDYIVSGINPGANVGRSVYHSGTVGAALTGRNGSIPGLAVSQAVSGAVEGQAWGEVVARMHWDTAAAVAAEVFSAMLADPRPVAGVINVNVPDLPVADVKGWAWSEVGTSVPRSMEKVVLNPKPGHEGSYVVDFSYGDASPQDPATDTAVIMADKVSLTWLSRITAEPPDSPAIDRALQDLIG